MDKPEDIMLSEKTSHKRTNTIQFHLYDIPRGVRFIETESRIRVARGWGGNGGGNTGKQCLTGMELQFGKMKNSRWMVVMALWTFKELDMTGWLYRPWNSPAQNTRVGSLSLLQGIFPTQGLKPGLPHCGWILYQLSHKGSLSLLQGIFLT